MFYSLLGVMAVMAAGAQEPLVKFKRIPSPDAAVAIAVADLMHMRPSEHPYQRYFHSLDGSAEFIGAFTYVMNAALGTGRRIVKPVVLADGYILRFDLRALVTQPEEYQRVFPLIEETAETDYYFHIPNAREASGETPAKSSTAAEALSKELDSFLAYLNTVATGATWVRYLQTEQLRFQLTLGHGADQKILQTILDRYNDYKHSNNDFFQNKQLVAVRQKLALWMSDIIQQAPKKGSTPGRLALHTGLEQMLLLQSLTKSKAPIIRADHFLWMASSTLTGGKYYEFRGLKRSNGSLTAEAQFLELAGAAPDRTKRLASSERAAMWGSGVTRKGRAVEFFSTTVLPPGYGGVGLLTITRDFFDGPVRGIDHVMKNLRDYNYDGSEAIAFNRNGTLIFALFDGKGDLVGVGPQNLVTDNRVPDGHTANLQPMISCIRCHGPNEFRQIVRNDVLTLAKSGLDVFDDPSAKTPWEALDEIKGMYEGEPENALRAARTAHASAVFDASGMQPAALAEKIVEIYDDYLFDAVTPRRVCLELGYQTDTEEEAVKLLNVLVPKMPPNASGVSTESVLIASLRAYNPEAPFLIHRWDYAQEFADIAIRARTQRILMGPPLPMEEVKPPAQP